MDSRVCKQCLKSKSADCFRGGRKKCKQCEYDDFCKWKLNNKDKVKESSKRYTEKHRQEIQNKANARYQNNKDLLREKAREYRAKNPEKTLLSAQKYYHKNRDERLAYHKEYRSKHKRQISENKLEYERKRIKTDANFKIRKMVRNAVYCAILRSGSRKNGSILDHLPYSIEELRKHLESLFEPWMTWENWGVYDPETWDESDSNTWTWQIDHIIPQSVLLYDSMDHPNFRLCWALDNLRPYSARANITECNRR